jgi:hypothetical protein
MEKNHVENSAALKIPPGVGTWRCPVEMVVPPNQSKSEVEMDDKYDNFHLI